MTVRAFFLLLTTITFLGCQSSPSETGISKRQVVFLFDVSDSIDKKDRESYFANFQQILRAMTGGDEFVVLKIGENSQLLKPIVEGVLPVKERGTTSGYYENERNKVLNGTIRQVGTFLNDTLDHRTSIISSLIAVNDFLANTGAKKKYVFIFSDMVEASSFLNMERGREFPVKRYIDINPNNLEGSQVYIVGVNTGEQHFEKAKQFWMAFLDQYQAKVVYYQYSLARFSF